MNIRKKLKAVKEYALSNLNRSDSTLKILENKIENKVYIERIVKKNKVRNLVDSYEYVRSNGEISILPLTLDTAEKIVERIRTSNMSYNACFVFHENESEDFKELDWVKTEKEHKYTSTGIKFWRHQQQMLEFRKPFDGSARNTVVSTHISPEGKCNLKCPYCSVTYRDTHSRISLERIKEYVNDLSSRGLKAVILTGGGEPTLYPHFNELVQWIKFEKGLSVALITNGTLIERRVDPLTLSCFSWIRVSINVFTGWENKIKLPTEHLDSNCIVGCSFVWTSEHESTEFDTSDRYDLLKKIAKVADNVGAQYVRVLPNCLLEQKQLVEQHVSLNRVLENFNDQRFFQQYKVHGAPECNTCHQSYFRPYLSEEAFEDGEPGTVYPCDSVVLNESVTHFAKKYQLCKPENVLDYMDGKIKHKFNASKDCGGCVFTDNVNMLNDWKENGRNKFDEFNERIMHEEFV